MSETSKLGIGNAVSQETVVFHGGITARDSFGRVTDLVVVWIRKEHQLNQNIASDLRVLVQGLLEFGFPQSKSTNGHLELAIENQRAYLGLRFNNFIIDEGDDVEKKLAKYWLNAEGASLIKKLLYPQDCVEVRFLKKANLIEWRIIRAMNPEAVSPDQKSFKVISDVEENFETKHQQFLEMGDIPYEEWVAEVYNNKHEKSKAGDLFKNGESVQNEDEWSRAAFDRDIKVIDDSVMVFAAQKLKNEDGEIVFEPSSPEGQMVLLKERVHQHELMLKQKERLHQKSAMEMTALREKLDNVIKAQQAGDTKQIQLFRDKAMQMFEMVKVVKAEKQQLEKTIFELKRNGVSGAAKTLDETPGMTIQLEDMTKKVDRFSRALEAEKQKVKVLSERVIAAEKEAQGASPVIDDLERKIENSLRMVQQYKKEVETVKQKVIQSESEKNKIKNDLIKAQAQIQTLMKRQAS